MLLIMAVFVGRLFQSTTVRQKKEKFEMAVLQYWTGVLEWVATFSSFFTPWSYAVYFKKIFFMPLSYLSVFFLLCFNLWSWSFGIDKFSLTGNLRTHLWCQSYVTSLAQCPRETTSVQSVSKGDNFFATLRGVSNPNRQFTKTFLPSGALHSRTTFL